MIFGKNNSIEAAEAELEQELRSFRESVHAWSQAEYGRSRSQAPATLHHTWRLAVSWALGCMLVLGGLSAGLYERHLQKELAKNHAAQQGSQQQLAAQAQGAATPAENLTEAPSVQVAHMDASASDATLLAAVDSDVSRQVPSALEPLAQLMENGSGQ